MVVLFSLLTVQTMAQPTNAKGWYDRADIENIDIGWMKTLQFATPAKPFAQNGWSYPAQQTETSQKLTAWLQQTYTPKGMLGELKQSVYAPPAPEPLTSRSYNFNEAEKNNRNALPNTYGAVAVMDVLLVKTATQKFSPMYGNRATLKWNIMANNIELITSQQVGLSSPDEYYCTMPRYTIGMKGEYDKDWMEQMARYRNFTDNPALKNYEHYLIPPKAIASSAGSYAVIMTKDRQPLPFEQVTVAQLISRLEKQLPMLYKIALNNGSKDIDLMERAKRGFGYFKEQYKNRLNEFVYIAGAHSIIDIFDFTDADPGKDFGWIRTQAIVQENRDYTSTNFPLLRLKKGVKEACASGTPQWIVFRVESSIAAGNAGEIHLMETFMNRFNYNYVYRYFFGNEKVTDPYKPVNFISSNEQNNLQASLPLSDKAKQITADESVLYYEDFSTVAIGAAPANWKTQRSEISGDKVGVTEVNGVKGKWLKLKRTASPTNMTLPLSGDFTISFDLLVQKGDVPWGTPGMQLQLYSATKVASGSACNLSIDVSPGDMNRKDAAGWVMIGRVMPEGYWPCKVANYYSLPAFTGSNATNQVNMAVQKKGDTIIVFCNNSEVYKCDKALPAAMSFNDIRFYVNEKNVYHISNILVKR